MSILDKIQEILNEVAIEKQIKDAGSNRTEFLRWGPGVLFALTKKGIEHFSQPEVREIISFRLKLDNLKQAGEGNSKKALSLDNKIVKTFKKLNPEVFLKDAEKARKALKLK